MAHGPISLEKIVHFHLILGGLLDHFEAALVVFAVLNWN